MLHFLVTHSPEFLSSVLASLSQLEMQLLRTVEREKQLCRHFDVWWHGKRESNVNTEFRAGTTWRWDGVSGGTVTEMVNLELLRDGKRNKAMPVRTLGCPPLPVLTSVMKQERTFTQSILKITEKYSH